MNPAAPIADPTAAKPSYDNGTCRSVTTGFDTPEKTAFTVRPSPTPLPTAVITSPSVVPSSTSPTSGATTSPTTVQTTLPGDSGVPSVRCQSAPRTRIHGMLHRVSTLLT